MLLPVLAAAVLAVPQERTPLEFRADVRLIRLDVSVVTRDGRSVAGLRAEDFRITENGRPMEISYFEAVEPREEVEAAADAGRPGRRIVLLVDAGGMTQGQLLRARQSAARFVRDAARPGDWLRLANLTSGQVWDGRIPEDRMRLETAARALARGPIVASADSSLMSPIVDRLEIEPRDGRPSTADSSGRFLSVFAEASGVLGTMEALLVQLGGVEGRKALVLISPGFPQLRDLDRKLERVATLAREAATAVYFLDAAGTDGLLPEGGQRLGSAYDRIWTRSGGAQDLAEVTGGFALHFANSLVPGLERIGGEMRTYYVVGYVPSRPDDGKFRSVKVDVKVDGLKARTKKGYLAGGRR